MLIEAVQRLRDKWNFRTTAKASYPEYKMNVHECVLGCSDYVENLAGWNICVKGRWTLVSELRWGAQAHFFFYYIGNFLLTSMKRQNIYKKRKSNYGFLCFYSEKKTRFQETSIFRKKKNILLFSKANTKMGPSWIPWHDATLENSKKIKQ